MTKRLAVLAAVLGCVAMAKAAGPTTREVEGMLAREKLPAHPRLIWPAGETEAVKARIAADPLLGDVEKVVRSEAERVLGQAPVERVLEGRRLLGVSREFLGRMTVLATEYRLTGERKYAERAVREMLAVCAFVDWHREHYLDVAEITAGMAVGYDWCFDVLTEEQRRVIREAIVVKGMEPSYVGKEGWINGTNNWNQVCNGGLTLGALAVAEDGPAKAAGIIQRALTSVPHTMAEYGTDGAYPEGPGYWEYGTTYNVLMISALQTALGTDFGLKASPGFMKTADFELHATGPSGEWFNFSDCGQRTAFSPAVAMWWFAAERGDASLLFNERKLLEGGLRHLPEKIRPDVRRMLPFMLVWAKGKSEVAAVPGSTSYIAQGDVPVAMIRSGWGDDAAFFGLKGGSPSASHAHMDVGSFVLDLGGVRWGDDLGMQDYNSLETAKVDLWNFKQESQRWDVFRLNASSHSVLTVDGKPQRVAGHGRIVASGKEFAVVETSEVYKGQLGAARRGMRLVGETGALIQDEVTGGAEAHVVRWAMLTRATVELRGDVATLTRNGKTVTLVSPGARWKMYSTEPVQPFDAKNPGTRLVGFEVTLAASEAKTMTVIATSGEAGPLDEGIKPLAEWK